MIFSSIRLRLQAWHGALLIVLVTAFSFALHRLVTNERLRQVDEDLQTRAAQLAIAVPPTDGTPAPRATPRTRPGEAGNLADQITAGGAWFAVWQADGTMQSRSANAPAGLRAPVRASGESHAARTLVTAREFFRFTPAGRCFLTGRDIMPVLAESRRLAWQLAAAGFGVLAFGLLMGWWISTRALRPVERISATAEKIATGDLSQRVNAAGFADELKRLAGVLNSTFARLETSFAQQARFTADAAHELRTPLSVILMQAQNGLASEGLGAEQREAFEACERAARRMRSLIESLLHLARLDAGQEPPERKPCDLASIARECAELVRPLAEARHLSIHADLSEAKCSADPEHIGQVVTNLLSNAIAYNREHGEIRIATRAEGGVVLLEVSDTGAGITPEHLPHIFVRFYRADSARTIGPGGKGHSGIGLAISKAIVEAHAGSIEVKSGQGSGTTFTVRLPGAV